MSYLSKKLKQDSEFWRESFKGLRDELRKMESGDFERNAEHYDSVIRRINSVWTRIDAYERYIVCPSCDYYWRMKRPHDIYNPPSSCPMS